MIIAVANQKGGVGKTTTAVNLAHGAALKGLRVLLIDLDTQGNVADSLGLESGPDLYQWLILEVPLSQIARPARPGMDVIRADKTTAILKMTLSGMDFREMVLSNALLRYDYNLVIFDCAPSVDVLHTAALVAADYLLIPTKLDQFGVKGVSEMLRSLAAVQKAIRTQCQLAGILPTFYDRVTSESHAQLVNMARSFQTYIWPPIPQDTQCRVANRKGKTLWEMGSCRALDGIGPAIGGYRQALERLLMLK